MKGEILSIESSAKIAELEKENKHLNEQLDIALKEYDELLKLKEKTIDYFKGILKEEYLDKSNEINIVLVEYGLEMLEGKDKNDE